MNQDLKELFAIDRAFCKESQKNGVKAWINYLSEDVVFGGEPDDPYVQGKRKILPSMEHLYRLKDLHFTWEPKHAFISEDKTLGVTTGTYERVYSLNGEVIKRCGKYTTTWKKHKGEWKIVFDIGN